MSSLAFKFSKPSLNQKMVLKNSAQIKKKEKKIKTKYDNILDFD